MAASGGGCAGISREAIMTFSMLDELFTLGDHDFSFKAKTKPNICRVTISCSMCENGLKIPAEPDNLPETNAIVSKLYNARNKGQDALIWDN